MFDRYVNAASPPGTLGEPMFTRLWEGPTRSTRTDNGVKIYWPGVELEVKYRLSESTVAMVPGNRFLITHLENRCYDGTIGTPRSNITAMLHMLATANDFAIRTSRSILHVVRCVPNTVRLFEALDVYSYCDLSGQPIEQRYFFGKDPMLFMAAGLPDPRFEDLGDYVIPQAAQLLSELYASLSS